MLKMNGWTWSHSSVKIESPKGRRRYELTAWTKSPVAREKATEMNRACLTFLVALVGTGLAALSSAAQLWLPTGIPVCQNGCAGDIPRIVPDGMSGAFIAWRDGHNNDSVYLQRITGAGLVAPGWPASGLPVSILPSGQEFSGMALDGVGGALVAWEDFRSAASEGRDPYAQRVSSDGSLPAGWALNGNPASMAPAEQLYPQVGPDGSGGAYVAWMDSRNYASNDYDVYAQHLTAGGTVASGWPAGGLPLCTLPGTQGDPLVVPDDSGGAVIQWDDGRAGAPGGYAVRVEGDGSLAAGWPANGLRLSSRGIGAVARDGAGGFYAVSSTPAGGGFDGAYYLMRYTFAGPPAPAWPSSGVLVCNAPGIRAGVTIDGDGAGGALLSWYDYRPPFDLTGGEIFAARVLSSGTLAPGWTVDGTLLSNPTDAMQAYDPFIVRDGLGGGYIVWQSQGGTQRPSWIQHLTGSGQAAAGWPQYGLRVASSVRQSDTRIATDGQGGAIVAWDEVCCGRIGVWAQRFAPDGPTPVLLSLVSAEARPDRVLLTWFAGDGSGLSASVYRRTPGSDWQRLGSVTADGTDRLRYEDHTVVGGERYAYRLGYEAGGGEVFNAEVWLDVPAGYKLALAGLRPNPADGDLTASFSLPSAEPARLQLLDVTGRVWLTREVGGLGAGNHLISLGEGVSVPAGMYWLRLTQGGRSLLARGVVVR